MKKENNVTEMEKVVDEMEEIENEELMNTEAPEEEYVPFGVACRSIAHCVNVKTRKIRKAIITGAVGTGIALIIGYVWCKTHDGSAEDSDEEDVTIGGDEETVIDVGDGYVTFTPKDDEVSEDSTNEKAE